MDSRAKSFRIRPTRATLEQACYVECALTNTAIDHARRHQPKAALLAALAHLRAARERLHGEG